MISWFPPCDPNTSPTAHASVDEIADTPDHESSRVPSSVILSVFVHDAPAIGVAIARGVAAEAANTKEMANRRTRTRLHEDSFDSNRSLRRAAGRGASDR
jgi:methylthioribose-1-phosphate isomerase